MKLSTLAKPFMHLDSFSYSTMVDDPPTPFPRRSTRESQVSMSYSARVNINPSLPMSRKVHDTMVVRRLIRISHVCPDKAIPKEVRYLMYKGCVRLLTYQEKEGGIVN